MEWGGRRSSRFGSVLEHSVHVENYAVGEERKNDSGNLVGRNKEIRRNSVSKRRLLEGF